MCSQEQEDGAQADKLQFAAEHVEVKFSQVYSKLCECEQKTD